MSMFLMSFIIYFLFSYACSMCTRLKTDISLFLRQGREYFSEDRLSTLTWS